MDGGTGRTTHRQEYSDGWAKGGVVDGSDHGIEDRAGRRTWLPAAALVGITLIFYHGLWLPGLVLIKRDAFRYFLPLKQHLVERLSAGEVPQWFPYEALGCPLIGVSGMGVFHPFTALYFLWPVHDAYRASTLLSCVIAALGAFVLGRTLGYSLAGAMLSGIAFALSGYVVSLTDNILFLYPVCALPFFCACLEKALRGSRTWLVAAAVVWSTVLLHGDVQTGYYYGFIALLWTIARMAGSRLDACTRLALVVCLAVLLAGIQLGPTWAAFVGSDRAQPGFFREQALHWSTHPLRLMTVFASPVGEYKDLADIGRFFFGNPHRPWSVWSESLYVGVPVTGLALLGAWHRRELRVLALLGCLALLLALGRYGGLYEVFYQAVPLWSAFRYPEKLMGLVSFAVAMLAGAGLDALRAGKGRPLFWLVAALLCACAGLWLRTAAAGAWATMEFGAPEALARSVTASAGRAFLFSAAATLSAWLTALGARRGWLRERFVLAAFVAIVTFDLASANIAAYHTGPAEAATFLPPFAEAIAGREGALGPGRFRLISLRDSQYVAPEDIGRIYGHDAQAVERRQALGMEHNAEFRLESASHYLSQRRNVLPSQIGLEAAARFNVAYYIGHRAFFQDPRFAATFMAALPDYDLALFGNPVPSSPRAYLSPHPERSAAPVEIKELLTRPDFLSGRLDLIEAPEGALAGPSTGGTVLIEQYAPEEVRVRVDILQPAVLILLDAYETGWTATLENGVALPILRANALVRAVPVPAGTHVVAFSYRTPLLRAGACISLIGVLLCFWLIAHARWRTNHMGRFRSERKAHGV
jgi:hypothetical protein